MTLTRRRLLGSTAVVAASAAAASLWRPEHVEAAPPAACAISYATTPETVVMHRLSYGPSPSAVAEYRALGATDDERYQTWVTQQLNPNAIDDSVCDQRLNATRLKIRYDGMNEARNLTLIKPDVTNQFLWTTYNGDGMAFSERQHPYNQVRVATWIRAVYSRRQLFEVLVDFWHNHFNVKATSDSKISATWPIYDRIMRTHALGNFRDFVTAVAQSVAMMYYLDNASNKVSGGEGGNENFSRELFELHTLGSDNYFKFYDDRTQIDTVSYGSETFLAGYVDDDVYEASYALTGWTINETNGDFEFKPTWHQAGGKRVLTNSFSEIIEVKSDPVQEGHEVIRRVAFHPGTARSLCTKLARRFVADNPPAELIDQAVEVWMAHRESPDQIKRVLEVILLSDACKNTFGQKVKRPLETLWGYLRATNANLPTDEAMVGGDASKGGYWGSLLWSVDSSGHALFGWDTPTGHPDRADYWANTNGVLKRWNLPYELTQSWGGNVQIDVVGQTPAGNCYQIVDYWLDRLIGYPVAAWVRAALVEFLAQGLDPSGPPTPLPKSPDWGEQAAIADRLRGLVQLIVASPEFNLR